MDKAEKAALEKYPHEVFDNIVGSSVGDSLRAACMVGYHQAEKDLGWHSVKESLPPMDEEVIVLSDIINGKEVHGACCISFGHIVDKRYCVDYDGWNIPGIHHWMPCPKINGKELGLITKEDL